MQLIMYESCALNYVKITLKYVEHAMNFCKIGAQENAPSFRIQTPER